jgi:hypothetical protein
MAEFTTTRSPKNKSAEPAQGRVQKPVHGFTHGSVEADMMFLQSTVGNHAAGRFLQTKVNVNQPGDKYEQEADRIAEQVIRMSEPLPVKPSAGSPPNLQRKCAACASGGGSCPKCAEEEKLLQRKPLAAQITPLIQREISTGETSAVSPPVESHIASLHGCGQPLPESVRAFFEPRFGVDFSQVRVHTDSHAARSVRAVNARAFTVGGDIVFGTGEYSPATTPGKRLFAHELAHTIQQKAPVIVRVPSNRELPANPKSLSMSKPAQKHQQTNQRICLSVYFSKNSSKLDETSRSALERLSIKLRHLMSATVIVNGYTSSEGEKKYNLELSENRRQTVIAILKPPSGIKIEGNACIGHLGSEIRPNLEVLWGSNSQRTEAKIGELTLRFPFVGEG